MEQDNNKLSSGLSELATLKKENEELKERNRVLVEALTPIIPWMIKLKEQGVFVPDSLADYYLKHAKEALQSNQ